MRVYLINLDSRPDRLEWSQSQLMRLGIAFERIAAIGRQEASLLTGTVRFSPHWKHPLTEGELGCFFSHLKTWRKFVDTGEEQCLILEDDIVASRSLRSFLDRFHEIRFEGDTIRLETYLKKVCLKNRPAYRAGGMALHNLYSEHWGSAAYILSRRLAVKLVESPELPLLPVDHLLFDPVSPFFNPKNAFQTVPAPCIQGDRLPGQDGENLYRSDLNPVRDVRSQVSKEVMKQRFLFWKIWREVLRIAHQIGNIPRSFIEARTRHWAVVPFSEDNPAPELCRS
jgi:glycosyl transferase, family 25